ncbi:MAG TPA: response regulator, partial [Pyrinomonadaceae bacterium]
MNNSERTREKILVVDDEQPIRDLLCELLGADYDCAYASSAEEALEVFSRESFSLVLSDINMGGMSGLEMVPLVLKSSPDTVVVMLTGSQEIESAVAALRVGAYDYVTKPFDLHQVESGTRRAVEHYGLRLAKRRYENHLEELVSRRTRELEKAVASLNDSYRSTLKALTSALETRDHETRGHSERVVNISLRLGREMGLGRERLTSLEFGALLHDIGKIGVPD